MSLFNPPEVTLEQVRVAESGGVVYLHVGDRTVHFPCLAALHMSGKFLAAGLASVSGTTGPFPEGEARITLWEMWGDGCWMPALTIRTVQELETQLARVRTEGIPHRITLDLVLDPLEPPPTKEPHT